MTLSATCASGAAAIAYAAEQLVLGQAEVMLAGGAEALRRGKHVLVDKPLVQTLAQAAALEKEGPGGAGGGPS
mgnify:CR=1 FL=1